LITPEEVILSTNGFADRDRLRPSAQPRPVKAAPVAATTPSFVQAPSQVFTPGASAGL
jgi:hypothetical protein